MWPRSLIADTANCSRGCASSKRLPTIPQQNGSKSATTFGTVAVDSDGNFLTSEASSNGFRRLSDCDWTSPTASPVAGNRHPAAKSCRCSAASTILCAVRKLMPNARAAALIDAPSRRAANTAITVWTGCVVTPDAISSDARSASTCIASVCAEACTVRAGLGCTGWRLRGRAAQVVVLNSRQRSGVTASSGRRVRAEMGPSAVAAAGAPRRESRYDATRARRPLTRRMLPAARCRTRRATRVPR